jgi:hypothetical protein
MATLTELMTGRVEIPEHLEVDAEIPVLAGLQVQGDIAIIPTRASAKPGALVPAEGVAVVRGENGGNTHLLVGEGVMWAPAVNRGQGLGVVTVPKGGTGYLLHPEHGANALAPGSYSLRRQREQADAIRLIQD